MLTNYHSHTKRCQHAVGEDEEYVRSAIRAGYKVLGFSDHAPYFYRDGYVSYYKMKPEQLCEYADSVNFLRKKYEKEIEIHLGLEAEYYPDIFPESFKLWKSVGTEYLILGQHFVKKEEASQKASSMTSSKEKLKEYTDVCIAAIETEKFSCIAHPDMLYYADSDDAFYEHEVRRLVECANKHSTPLEINLLGIRKHRHYPGEKFWKTAALLSPAVILGTDSHNPLAIENTEGRREAEKLAERCGLRLIDRLEFKPL